MKNKLLTTFFIILFLSSNGWAQDVRVLNFDESLSIALKSSYTFKELENNFKRDYYVLKAQQAGLKSSAGMQFSLPAFDESITQQYNSVTETHEFVSSKTLRYKSKLVVNQPVPTGGNLSFNANLSTLDQFNNSMDYIGSIFLKFEQPILQPNQRKNDLERAEINLERTRLNYASRKSGSLSWMTGIYYDLFRFQKQIQLKEVLLSELQQIHIDAGANNRDAGIDSTELLQLIMDIDNLSSDLFKLRTDRQNREERFKQQIGLDQSVSIAVAEEEDVTPVSVNLEDALMKGMQYRPEVKRYELDLRNRNIAIEQIKSQGRLRGSIEVTFGFDNIDEELSRILVDYNQSRSIKLELSLPILDWGRNKARLAEQNIIKETIVNNQDNQSKQIRREISDAYFSLQESINRLDNLKDSQDNAQRSYRLTKEQFAQSEVKAQDLRLARERLIETVDRWLNSLVDYKEAILEMNRMTMWDFQKNREFVTDEEINEIIRVIENNENNN
ncbi:MAG: TolC family protein [bacterium]|nr:TolC family protein [bacterium]